MRSACAGEQRGKMANDNDPWKKARRQARQEAHTAFLFAVIAALLALLAVALTKRFF
jgi:hypothetical protein